MGKNFMKLQEQFPGIILKSHRSVADPRDEDGEPAVFDIPIWDEDELEWAAGLILEEKDRTGKLPSMLAGFYKPKGCMGWKYVVIVTEVL